MRQNKLFSFHSNQKPHRFHGCFNRRFSIVAMRVAHSRLLPLLIPHHIKDAPRPCAEYLAYYKKSCAFHLGCKASRFYPSFPFVFKLIA